MKTFNIGYSNDSLLELEKNAQISSNWLKLIESEKHIIRKVTTEETEIMTSSDIEGLDVLQLGGRKVDMSTLEKSERLSLIVRHGVGYDNVDVDEDGPFITISKDVPNEVWEPEHLGDR